MDTYGHLIPSANVSFIDQLDVLPEAVQQNATPAQPAEKSEAEKPAEVIEEFGGGVWTRTTDLRIMRPSL